MSSHNQSILRDTINTGKDITYAGILTRYLLPVENKPDKAWWIVLVRSRLRSFVMGGREKVGYTFWTGIGAWGLNKSIVGWSWDITDFVWWVGIGHAGTLISAVLLLFRQNWHNSINRSARGDVQSLP